MIRVLLAFAVAGLTAAAAFADARTDSAIRTFRNVGYSPYKLQTYCQFSDVADAQGDKDDEASEAALDPYMDRLGEDFEAAWETVEETDENSYDGRRLAAELEALDNRCPDSGADDGDDDDDDAADAADDADDAGDAADTIIDILGDQ